MFHWIGGVTQDQSLNRPVKCYAHMADYPKLTAKLRAWHTERLNATEIAERLMRGIPTAETNDTFHRVDGTQAVGTPGSARPRTPGKSSGVGSARMAAGHFGTPPRHLANHQQWRSKGWLHSHRDADGYWVLWADADEITRLRELHALPRTWANKSRLKQLIKPKRRPKR